MSNRLFRAEDYPNEVSCIAFPEFEGVVEIEIDDTQRGRMLLKVFPEAVRRVSMPPVPESVPDGARKLFKSGIGIGLVACEVIGITEESPQFLNINLPGVEGPQPLAVSPSSLVHSL